MAGRKSEARINSNDKERGAGGFRAREMPKYTFFEVKHESHKKVLF